MTEIFNLYTLCRCCHSDGSFKSLQLPYAYNNGVEVYATMLKEILNITINAPTFEASYAICDFCIKKLRDASYFKKQILECERKFEEYCTNEQAFVKEETLDYEDSDNSYLDGDEPNTVDNSESIVKNVDEKLNIKIKAENEDPPLNSIQETIPIEYEVDDTVKQSPEKKIKNHDIQARFRKLKPSNCKIDPELETYVKTEEGGTYICKMCDKKFKLLKLLRNHISKQHKDAYKCQICSLQCDGRFHFVRHRRTHFSELFKCQFCEKTFPKNKSFKAHMNTHTRTEKFQCDICHKLFPIKASLKKHILWHYGGNKKCICDICGRGFNDIANLNSHIRTVHEKLRPFKCHLCPKTFTANKYLKEHICQHTGEWPFKCDTCNEGFITTWKLRYHECRKHPSPGGGAPKKEPYTCKICKLDIDTRHHLMTHLKTHIGEKEYKCHLCTKDFTCKYSLNRHIVAHSGLRTYACDMCDKKYSQPSILCRHKKRIHDPNSPTYSGRVVELTKCDLCNKSFKNIQKHMVSHKLRPHVCEICLKAYPERNTLNRHIQVVHQGVRRHPCTLCNKKYTKWTGLHRHTLKVHKLELKKETAET